MKATVLHGVGDIRVIDVPDPGIQESTDALVRIRAAAVCGSDLWPYRGKEAFATQDRMGHEWIGTVEAVGREVSTLEPGDTVVAPFAYACGACRACRDRIHTSCAQGGFWGGSHDGGQAEAIRVPFADATLVPVAAQVDDELVRRLLPLTDVMATGCHAITLSGTQPGGTVVVIGDGAVGLSAILAARRAGVDRILAVTRHPDRAALARQLGATDVLTDGASATTDLIHDATAGGATAVAECVGTQAALDLALTIVRPGGTIGSVGVPNGVSNIDLYRFFRSNITLRAGVTPARAYLDSLISDVLDDRLDPSPILTTTVPLADVADAYRSMDRRETTKALILP